MSRIRLAASALVVLVVAISAFWVATGPPEPIRKVITHDRPSPVAGDAVPPMASRPSVRIAVAGDTGTGDAAERATVSSMVTQGRTVPYDALVLLGDLVYEDGKAALTQSRVAKPFAPLLKDGATLVPVLGNHDVRSGQQEQILHSLGRQHPWYAQRIGPLRILVLDSNRVDDPDQNRWLRAMLERRQPAGTWTVAAMHHPAYSAGSHGSDLKVRNAWAPLFSQAGVRLVLAGHDHDYQRSTPENGVTYVVSGAGAKLRAAGSRDFTAVSTSQLHYLDLLVYADRLEGRAIDQTGRLVDSFTITR